MKATQSSFKFKKEFKEDSKLSWLEEIQELNKNGYLTIPEKKEKVSSDNDDGQECDCEDEVSIVQEIC